MERQRRSPRTVRNLGPFTLLAALLAVVIVSSGCGGSDTSVGSSAGSSAGSAGLPKVDLVEVASGDRVDMSSLAPSPTPILAWFWAPH